MKVIDRRSRGCKLNRPDPGLRATYRGDFILAIEAHLVELERKHRVLENELHEALMHLSTDDAQINELKRRKLLLKDEIERLKQAASATVH